MREFFQSWKRKIGVVTLVVACVFMIGWVRSFYKSGFVDLPKWTAGEIRIGISVGTIWFHHLLRPSASTGGAPRLEWEWSLLNFSFEEWYMRDDVQVISGIIPFWSIVLPLTMLSAYLLLSKPHNSVLKKTSETTPAEGA